MAKGFSHKQEFFESKIFSRQNRPEREFSSNAYKSSAPKYFWEIWLFLIIFSNYKPNGRFLEGAFALNWIKLIF